MVKGHGKDGKNNKFENPCYINGCHHGDNTQNKKSKRKTKAKKRKLGEQPIK